MMDMESSGRRGHVRVSSYRIDRGESETRVRGPAVRWPEIGEQRGVSPIAFARISTCSDLRFR